MTARALMPVLATPAQAGVKPVLALSIQSRYCKGHKLITNSEECPLLSQLNFRYLDGSPQITLVATCMKPRAAAP